jgi:hypothetical protein
VHRAVRPPSHHRHKLEKLGAADQGDDGETEASGAEQKPRHVCTPSFRGHKAAADLPAITLIGLTKRISPVKRRRNGRGAHDYITPTPFGRRGSTASPAAAASFYASTEDDEERELPAGLLALAHPTRATLPYKGLALARPRLLLEAFRSFPRPKALASADRRTA